MTDWGVREWLEGLAYLVAILGGIAAAFLYFQGARKEAISVARKEIARAWTNEGDITSTETRFITLELEDKSGDLIGSLSTNAYDRPLEVHADVGWFSTRLDISELRGRNVVSIATAKVTLTGNNNRLEWRLTERQGTEVLPKKTVLWPSEVGVSH